MSSSGSPEGLAKRDVIEVLPDTVCRGGSCIVNPFGHLVTELVWGEEMFVYAKLDMQANHDQQDGAQPVGTLRPPRCARI